MRLSSIFLATIIVMAAFSGCIALADSGTLSAAFEVSMARGQAPFTTEFLDASTGNITGWQWNFGDGQDNVTDQHTMHTYQVPGTYTVILTVTDGLQNSSTSEQITVDPSLFADFASNTINESSMLIVQFYETSAGNPTAWEWDFGDGTANNTDPNPSHTFPSRGTYTVTLTVTDGIQSDSTSMQIDVVDGPAPTLNVEQPPAASPTPALPASIAILALVTATGLISIARGTRKK